MSARRHLVLAFLALTLGLATSLATALAIARFRPLPQYPRTVARAFLLNGRAFAAAEVHVTGGTSIWWDDLSVSSVPPPRSGAARTLEVLGITRRGTTKTPDQLLADARATHAQLAQERDGFVAFDDPPHWGTFARPGSPPTPDTLGEDAAFGFPIPCLWYRVVSQARGNASVGATIEHGYHIRGTPNARATGSFIVLPLRPIWSGLVLNSVAFAGFWWAALAGPSAARRNLRRRRGRCLACGYDLRDIPREQPCPECGAPRAG